MLWRPAGRTASPLGWRTWSTQRSISIFSLVRRFLSKIRKTNSIHRLRAHTVGEQTELLLDAVLHVTACTVEFFVQLPGPPRSLAGQRGDHKARILIAVDVFGLSDHAPRTVPAAFFVFPVLYIRTR